MPLKADSERVVRYFGFFQQILSSWVGNGYETGINVVRMAKERQQFAHSFAGASYAPLV